MMWKEEEEPANRRTWLMWEEDDKNRWLVIHREAYEMNDEAVQDL
jgi:hypothetical protein